MLRFFRKIRQKLLNNGNFGQYLIYAIGEILLVMIGILLALQINNWNDARKNRQSFELLLDKIEADLKSNIKESNIGIEYYFWRDSLLELVYEEKVTKEMYQRIPRLRSLIFGGWNQDLLMDNIQILIEREENVPAIYKEIFPLVKSYKSWVGNYQRNEPLIRNNVIENRSYFSENFPWFRRSDSLSVQQSIQYFISDSLYWNRAEEYRRLHISGGNRVIRCRNEALVLLAKILLIRGKLTPSKLPSFFQKYGSKPLEKLECQEEMDLNKPATSLARYFIFNNNDTPVQLLVYEENKPPKSITIPPSINWQIRAADNISRNHILELNNEECHMRFRPVKNGFLLIE